MILAYFHNVIHLLSQLTDTELLHLAIMESSKIIPYVVSSRKSVKQYLKVGGFKILSRGVPEFYLSEMSGIVVQR